MYMQPVRLLLRNALLAVGTSCVSLLYTCVAGDAVHAGVPADVAL